MVATIRLIQNAGVEIRRAKNMYKTRSLVLSKVIVNVFISIPLIKKFRLVGANMGTALSMFVGNIILFMNWNHTKNLA